MKKETRLLKAKALSSLLLGVEHFNRPWDVGRTDAVLMFLDHSFEMLLKAAILQRDGQIRDKGAKNTIGFDACVRKGVSDGQVKFILPTACNFKLLSRITVIEVTGNLVHAGFKPPAEAFANTG